RGFSWRTCIDATTLATVVVGRQTAAMTDLTTPARALETRMRNDIPLTRAIDLRVRHADADTLILAAPLAPNINDKGCAFGGSLVSLMTIAGWAHVVLALEARGLD